MDIHRFGGWEENPIYGSCGVGHYEWTELHKYEVQHNRHESPLESRPLGPDDGDVQCVNGKGEHGVWRFHEGQGWADTFANYWKRLS